MKQLFFYSLLLFSFNAIGQHPLGLDYDDEAYNEIPMKANLTRSLYDDIPKTATIKTYCPPVGHQQFNDCVGWASSYGARSILFNQKHNRTGDKAAIFSPTYLHRSVAVDCKSTAVTEKALGFLKEVGTLPFGLLTYGCMEDIPEESLKALAMKFRITEYEKLFSKEEQNGKTKILKVKKALSEGNPVVIGMDVYKSFMDADGQALWNPVQGDIKIGGHAMVVVSYDDDKEGGAFEVMNSWGDDWGKKGFIWVRYAHFAAHVKRAYTMVVDNNSNEEEAAYEGMIKPDSISHAMANVNATPKNPDMPTATQVTQLAARLAPFSGSLRLVTTDSVAIPLSNTYNEGDGFKVQGNELSNISPTQLPYYTTEKSYRNDTEFRIYVQNLQTAYVYVLGLDVSGEVSCLFPYEKNISPRLDYSKNEIALPDEDHFIFLQDPVGDEWMCVLYSKTKLNIESTVAEIKKESGNLLQRIEKIFGENCVKASQIQYNEKLAAFEANVPPKAVVPLIIKIKHVE